MSVLVMDDSEISKPDSIRFLKINLDFELRAIYTVYTQRRLVTNRCMSAADGRRSSVHC